MENQQEIDAALEKWHATKTNMSMAATTFGAISLATHTPGGIFFGALTAFVAARHGDDIARGVRHAIPQSLVDAAMDRLRRKEAQPKELNTEIVQGGQATHILLEKNTSFDFEDDDDILVMPLQQKSQNKRGLFLFSELLASGFIPTLKKIFVGRDVETGKDIFVAAEDLCHVALAGKTGGGKGSLMRLIMVQLCYVGAKVLLLNPHYMRWVVAKDGSAFDEDWTPFEGINLHKRTKRYPNGAPYLEVPPCDCAEYAPIEHYLTWAIDTLLQDRRVQGRDGGKVFVPYFIVLDEWPSIAAEVKDAATNLAKLLREGRKYGIFVIVASQDFLVKTIGMDGGSVRKCLLTTYYTGGDLTTAKELLNEQMRDIPENDLGKGVVLLRCRGLQKATLVRVPFVDNESVYKLLGPSTYKQLKKSASKQDDEMPQIDVIPAISENITLSYEQLLATTQHQQSKDTDDLPVDTTQRIIGYAPAYSNNYYMRAEYPEVVEQHAYYQSPYRTEPNLNEMLSSQIPMMAQRDEQQIVAYPPARRTTSTLPQELQKALDAYRSGMSYRDLAKAIGVNKDTAGKRIEELRRRKLI